MKYPVQPVTSCGTYVVRLLPPYAVDNGASVYVPFARLATSADTKDSPENSPLVVCEDGDPLPLGHADHVDIHNIGMGRYSHFGSYVRFSASDNSDPNTNGRVYEVALNSEHLSSTLNLGPKDGLMHDNTAHAGLAIFLGLLIIAISLKRLSAAKASTPNANC